LGFLIFVLLTTDEVAHLRADEGGGETWCWWPLCVEDFEALVEGMLVMRYWLSMVLGKERLMAMSHL
jgi:hypothetical protein